MFARVAVLAAMVCTLAFGQGAEKKLVFEAASVKPGNPSGGPFGMTTGGPGTKDPGRIRYTNTTLRAVLVTAYGVSDFQIEGPGWMASDRFDIDATMPADTTREQLKEMLRNLVVERFRMEVHRETKVVAAHTLVAGRNGVRMVESAPTAAAGAEGPMPPRQFERDKDGFPKLPAGGPAGMLQFVAPPRARLQGRQQTMGDLAERLAYLLGHPVTDGTGLTGKYDFILTFASEGTALARAPLPPGGEGANADGAAEDLFSAVQSQLGLRLEARRAPVEMVVIDRVEKTPVAN